MYCKKLDQELQARTEICDFCSEKEGCFHDGTIDENEGSLDAQDTVALKSSQEDGEMDLRGEHVEEMKDEIAEELCTERDSDTGEADSLGARREDINHSDEHEKTELEEDGDKAGVESEKHGDFSELEVEKDSLQDEAGSEDMQIHDVELEGEHVWPEVPEDVLKYSAEVGWTNNIDNEWMGFDGNDEINMTSDDSEESSKGWSMGDLNSIVQAHEYEEGATADLSVFGDCPKSAVSDDGFSIDEDEALTQEAESDFSCAEVSADEKVHQSDSEHAEEVSEESVEEAVESAEEVAEESVEEAAETAEEVSEENAEEVAESVEEAVESAEEATESAEKAEEIVAEAAEIVEEATESAEEVAEESVGEAVESAEEIAENAEEVATESAEEAAESVEEATESAEKAEEIVEEAAESVAEAAEIVEEAAEKDNEAAEDGKEVFNGEQESKYAGEMSNEAPDWLKEISGDIDDEAKSPGTTGIEEKVAATAQSYGGMDDILNLFFGAVTIPNDVVDNTELAGKSDVDTQARLGKSETEELGVMGAQTNSTDAYAEEKMADDEFGRFAEDMLKEFEKDSKALENELGKATDEKKSSPLDSFGAGGDTWNEDIINDFNRANEIADTATNMSAYDTGGVQIARISEAPDAINPFSGGTDGIAGKAELNEVALHEGMDMGHALENAVQGDDTYLKASTNMDSKGQGHVNNDFDDEISMEMERLSSIMDALKTGSGEFNPLNSFDSFVGSAASAGVGAYGFDMGTNQSFQQPNMAGSSFNFDFGLETDAVKPAISGTDSAIGVQKQGFESNFGAVPYAVQEADLGMGAMQVNPFPTPSITDYKSEPTLFGNTSDSLQAQNTTGMGFVATGVGDQMFQGLSSAGEMAPMPYGEIRNQTPIDVSGFGAVPEIRGNHGLGSGVGLYGAEESSFDMVGKEYASAQDGNVGFDDFFKGFDLQNTVAPVQEVIGANQFDVYGGAPLTQDGLGLRNGGDIGSLFDNAGETFDTSAIMQNILKPGDDGIDWSQFANKPSQVSNRNMQGEGYDFGNAGVDFNLTGGMTETAGQTASFGQDISFGQITQFEEPAQFNGAESVEPHGFKPLRSSSDTNFTLNLDDTQKKTEMDMGVALPGITGDNFADAPMGADVSIDMDVLAKNLELSNIDTEREPISNTSVESEQGFAEASADACVQDVETKATGSESENDVIGAGLPLDFLGILGLEDDLSAGIDAEVQNTICQKETEASIAERENTTAATNESEKHLKIEIDDFDVAGVSDSLSMVDASRVDEWAMLDDLVGLNISDKTEGEVTEEAIQNDTDSLGAIEEQMAIYDGDASDKCEPLPEAENDDMDRLETEGAGTDFSEHAQFEAGADLQTAEQFEACGDIQTDIQGYIQTGAQNTDTGGEDGMEKSTIRIDLGLGSDTDKNISIRELDESVGVQESIATDSLNAAVQDFADMNVPQTTDENEPKQKGGRKSIKILLWLILILIIVGCVVFVAVDLTPYGIDNQAFRESVLRTLGISIIVPDDFWLGDML